MWTVVRGILLGNYRIVEQLGRGGMGVVYVGRHETLGHRAAVKVLRSELSSHVDVVQRFFNEAQATTAIRNPGIVQVFDFGTTPDGRAYFVMELLEGETLAARLKKRQRDDAACCRFGRQVANVLQAAHAAGITHRDLKPDNLFLVPDAEVVGGERVKVLDFGIAKLAGEASVKTRTGRVMGTPKYMSPEQCRSANAADARSDIYSLGCILFEIACGSPPFVGTGFGQIVAAHLHDSPPHPQTLVPDLPDGLSALIATMLAKPPDARPQTMTEVSQALDEVLRTLGEALTRPPMASSGLHPTPRPGRIPTSVPGLSPMPTSMGTPTSTSMDTLTSASMGTPTSASMGTPTSASMGTPTSFSGLTATSASMGTPTSFSGFTATAASVGTAMPFPGILPAPLSPQIPMPVPGLTATSSPVGTAMPSPLPPASPSPLTAMPFPWLCSPPPVTHDPGPFPGFFPAPLSVPTPFLLPQGSPMLPAFPGFAEASGTQPRVDANRRLYILGCLIIAAAVAAIAIVLAFHHPHVPERLISYDQIAAAPRSATSVTARPPGSADGEVVATPRPTTMIVDAAQTVPPMTADDLEAECRGYQVDREWSELAQCADKLASLGSRRAAELKHRAVEEARSAPRISGVTLALQARNLIQAKAGLDQIWTGSVEYGKLKRTYDTAEAQAIGDLASQLAGVKGASCDAYHQLLAKARATNPVRVVTAAARRVPCTPPPACDADALATKGWQQYSVDRLAESLAAYEAAYACKPAPTLNLKAFVIACNLRSLAKARSHWKPLPPALRTLALGTCMRNGITKAMLDGR